MKIAVMSDLHGNLPKFDLEGVELLLICGDISPLQIQCDMPSIKDWISDEFFNWTQNLPVNKVIFIAGNHDFICERFDKSMRTIFSEDNKVTYIKNTVFDYFSNKNNKTYRIFGTPYCKQFGNWAFMRNDKTLMLKYSQMPDNIDIMISHDAPYHFNDLGYIPMYKKDVGNPVLTDILLKRKPKYFFCGHLHTGNHNIDTINNITCANTSLLNEQYELVYEPLIIEI